MDLCYFESNHEKFDCNIFLTDNSCLDENQRKETEIECDWQRHLARIERLAQPKKLTHDCPNIKDPGVPLQQLMPRIFKLSKPKLVTPKYVKPIVIPFDLPGKIQDWESHRKWLEKQAKPKKDHSGLPFEVNELCIQSRSGMRRIKQLAAPKTNFHKKK
ncbi:unnamed protein product [Diamesa serratosioi]